MEALVELESSCKFGKLGYQTYNWVSKYQFPASQDHLFIIMQTHVKQTLRSCSLNNAFRG